MNEGGQEGTAMYMAKMKHVAMLSRALMHERTAAVQQLQLD